VRSPNWSLKFKPLFLAVVSGSSSVLEELAVELESNRLCGNGCDSGAQFSKNVKTILGFSYNIIYADLKKNLRQSYEHS